VLVTGAGPAAAAVAAESALSRPLGAVIVAGVGGACSTLAPGTVVVATRLLDLDGAELAGEEAMGDSDTIGTIMAAVRRAVPDATSGGIASGADVIDNAQDRARLAGYGALAVETEAAGWVDACRRAAVPLVVIRGVVDSPERPLGPAAHLVRPGGSRPAPGAVIRLLLRPRNWRPLTRLARDASRAESAMAGAVAAAASALLRR
jgi:nucleoside phosphorylase